MSYLDTRGRRSVAVAFSYIEQKTERISVLIRALKAIDSKSNCEAL